MRFRWRFKRGRLSGFSVPMALALLARLLGGGNSHLPLLLPGIIALPVYAMLACLRGEVVPLSLPSEEAKSAGRGIQMMGVMMVSGLLALVATLSWNYGWFNWLVLVEAIVAIGLYLAIRASVGSSRWTSLE
jgi:hypothetical protein